MASSDDHTKSVETVKSKSPSSDSPNKRKRETTAVNNVNINEETKAAKQTTVGEAECMDIEMKDAEVAYNKPVEEKSITEGETNETVSDLNASHEVCKEDEGKKVESSEKQRNDKEDVLGEVATLLKQVQESDTKGKLEVEVKVKKLDNEDVKENGEVNDEEGQTRVKGELGSSVTNLAERPLAEK